MTTIALRGEVRELEYEARQFVQELLLSSNVRWDRYEHEKWAKRLSDASLNGRTQVRVVHPKTVSRKLYLIESVAVGTSIEVRTVSKEPTIELPHAEVESLARPQFLLGGRGGMRDAIRRGLTLFSPFVIAAPIIAYVNVPFGFAMFYLGALLLLAYSYAYGLRTGLHVIGPRYAIIGMVALSGLVLTAVVTGIPLTLSLKN